MNFVTLSLKQLWSERIQVLLANLAAGQEGYREINTLSRHIQADYEGRFLIELLQNASDQTIGREKARALHRS